MKNANKRQVVVKRAAKGTKARERKLGSKRVPVDKTVAATADALAATFCGTPGAIPIGSSDSMSICNAASVRFKVPLFADVFTDAAGVSGVRQPWLQINPGFFGLSATFAGGTVQYDGMQPGVNFVQHVDTLDNSSGSLWTYIIGSAPTDAAYGGFLESLINEADAYRVAGLSFEVVPTDSAIFRSGTWCVKMSSCQRGPNAEADEGTPGYWAQDPLYNGDPSLNGFSVAGVMPWYPQSVPTGPFVSSQDMQGNYNFDAVAPVSIPMTNDQAGFSAVVPPNFSVHDLFPTGGISGPEPATDIVLRAETWPAVNIFGDSFLVSALESGDLTPPAAENYLRLTVANVYINVAIEYAAQPNSLASYTVIERPLPQTVTTEIVEGLQSLRYAGGGTGLAVRGGMDELAKRVKSALLGTAKSVLPKAAGLLPKVARSVMDRFLPGAADVIGAGEKVIKALL